jgi:hypothetical protein
MADYIQHLNNDDLVLLTWDLFENFTAKELDLAMQRKRRTPSMMELCRFYGVEDIQSFKTAVYYAILQKAVNAEEN